MLTRKKIKKEKEQLMNMISLTFFEIIENIVSYFKKNRKFSNKLKKLQEKMKKKI